ncbi:MAG: hypothetical protein V1815_00730 [Candidatus Woesearchaeota archaeon]
MVNIVSDTGSAIISPLQNLWLEIVDVIPSFVAAVIVMIIGVFVAYIIGHAVRILLNKVRMDEWIRKAKLSRVAGSTDVPGLIGELIKWYIIILFLQQAVELINLGVLTTLLGNFANWLPNVIVAILVALAGLVVAHYVQIKISEQTKIKGMLGLSQILKAVIIIIFLLVAIKQIGIDVSFLENTFLIIVAAFGAGITLALGIGLGLGLKKEGESLIKEVKKNF